VTDRIAVAIILTGLALVWGVADIRRARKQGEECGLFSVSILTLFTVSLGFVIYAIIEEASNG